jgi:trk system potassium uptake protein TrkH
MQSLGFLRPLGQTWAGLALLIFLVSVFTLVFQAWIAAQAFLITAAMLGFAGGLIWSASAGVKLVARASEASAYVLALWVLTPPFLIVPFVLLTPGLTYVEAVFEAYSALTTTGAIILPPENVPDALIFWRCLVGFVGGYLTLLTAAGVLAAFDKSGLELRKSILLTYDRENIFSNLHVAARRIAVIYGGLAAVSFLALMMTSVPAFEALCLSLSALSTSGYTVSSGPLSGQVPPLAVMCLAVITLMGATNIAFLRSLVTWHDIEIEAESVAMVGVIMGLALLFMLATGGAAGPLSAIADSIFIVSTAGFTASNSAGHVPLAAVLAAIIGGAVASTSGGLKVSRLVILSRSALAELARMAHPSSVVRVTHRGRSTDNNAMLALWTTVLGYIGLVAIAVVGLALLGEPFESAWSAATTSISNAGPLHDQLSPERSWAQFSAPSQIFTIVLMVLGRLEVLAGLAAIAAIFRRL